MAVLHFYGLPEKLQLDTTRLCRYNMDPGSKIYASTKSTLCMGEKNFLVLVKYFNSIVNWDGWNYVVEFRVEFRIFLLLNFFI